MAQWTIQHHLQLVELAFESELRKCENSVATYIRRIFSQRTWKPFNGCSILFCLAVSALLFFQTLELASWLAWDCLKEGFSSFVVVNSNWKSHKNERIFVLSFVWAKRKINKTQILSFELNNDHLPTSALQKQTNIFLLQNWKLINKRTKWYLLFEIHRWMGITKPNGKLRTLHQFDDLKWGNALPSSHPGGRTNKTPRDGVNKSWNNLPLKYYFRGRYWKPLFPLTDHNYLSW